MATLGLNETDKQAVAEFRRDVVEPSQSKLVLIDFWAEWCGPCKQLSPIIEKIAAEYADRGVILVKINVDENRFIASQFRVQSIPTVYAFFQGQPVADLTSARTEGQYRQMLDQLLAQLPIESEASKQAQDIAPLITMGEETLAGGDHERAYSIFAQLADMAPDNGEIMGALFAPSSRWANWMRPRRCLAACRRTLPRTRTSSAAALPSRSPALPRPASRPGRSKRASPPIRMTMKRCSNCLRRAWRDGDHDGAADALLASIERDRSWEDGKARNQLLQLFEVVGLEDPWVSAQRRRLSAILFA